MKKVYIVLATIMLFTLCFQSSAIELVKVETKVKSILKVDGLEFKDLNSNSKLDIYEDWRRPSKDRVADLLSQMTLKEKVALLFHCMTAGQFSPTYPVTEQFLYEKNCPFPANILNGRYTTGYSIWYYVNEYKITTFLDDQSGTPAELCDYHNKAQEIAEASRLGIPITFSSNRESNTWGSMIDMPHVALGTANDPELSSQLWTIYGQEMKAVGYHVTLNPYGVELLGWYGEDPNYIAELTKREVEAMQAGGIQTCVKHFIARGGTSFSSARSVAQLYTNWMVPWKAAVDAGTGWIMTNSGTGLSNTVRVDYDKETMSYLRDVLGFEGVVLTDWGPVGGGTRNVAGITADGIDLSKLSLGQLYTMMLKNGVDQFGAVSVQPGEDKSAPRDISNWPDALVNAVNSGLCPVELVDRSAGRVLKSKFDLGLFDDPYVDVKAALELVASKEYIANPWPIVDNATLDAARNPRTAALDRKLQAASTVLIKNDNGLLPLEDGVKVFVTGSAADIAEKDAAAIGRFGIKVDALDKADVVVIRATAINDASKKLVTDAKAAGKLIIMALDCVEPDAWIIENTAAVLFLNYNVTTDHGTALPNFNRRTAPSVLAELVFGRSEPTGMLVKEIARSAEQKAAQWSDLSFDTGASDGVRLLLMQMVKNDPYAPLPTNFGDPLFTYSYGMRYGLNPKFAFNTLVAPKEVKAGGKFTVSCIITNSGAAGYTTVEVYDGSTLLGTKFMALDEGQFRVVQIECVIGVAGDHVIKLGQLSAKVKVN